MAEVVLDASAVLALVNDEPGAKRVADVLPNAALSAVNLSEVSAKLAEIGVPAPEIRSALDGLGLTIYAFDRETAYLAGTLRPATKEIGLSLGDRACLALALKLALPVLTTDQNWKSLKLGVKVEVIR